MSSRTSLATPCPAPTGLNPSHRRISSFELFGNDDTTNNIDFTRALDQPLTGIKPRRRSMMGGPARKKAGAAARVTIFEEVSEDQELVLGNPNHQKPVSGKILLSKPAQKMAIAGGIGVAAEQQNAGIGSNLGGGMSACVGGGLSGRSINAGTGAGALASTKYGVESDKVEISKKPRRATIYIPEDTTVMTIHPGANNTTRIDDTFHHQLSTYTVQPPKHVQVENRRTSFIAPPKSASKRQSLSAAPRRVPLYESKKNGNLQGWDIPGANTGKENIPPGAEKLMKQLTSLNICDDSDRPSLYNPTAASLYRQPTTSRTQVAFPNEQLRAQGAIPKISIDFRRKQPATTIAPTATKTSRIGAPRRQSIAPVTRGSQPSARYPTPPKTVKSAEEKQQIKSFIATKRNELQAAKVKQFPILAADLSHPELYEDDWLHQQEAALAEVVNHIFSTARPFNGHALTGEALRESLVEVYNQYDMVVLHRHLLASLDYGALAPPKETLFTRNPGMDIGLRKSLMNLWLDTYNEDALRAAAQVIAGRQIPRTADCSSCFHDDKLCTIDPHAERRALNAFLELFFVFVGDVDHDSEPNSLMSVDGNRWKKMMMRGLMLILLLDQAKTTGLVGGCLFKTTSTRQSSAAVLNAFKSLLLPSVGDIFRPLKHMKYEVKHIQDPLDEVTYRINNLATDLRDGVLLTRLVQILLCSRKAKSVQRHLPSQHDDTLAVSLHSRAVLVSELAPTNPQGFTASGGSTLSQYLKMPCLSHATKRHNVQIAFSALESHSVDGANIVGNITADDIVFGHREKTLSLLWSLVSTFGLAHLIDWKALTIDIARLGSQPIEINYNESITRKEGEQLLHLWASAYAVKAGLAPFENLTTSFVDGKVYAAIIDAFAEFIPQKTSKRSSTGSIKLGTHISDQLHALGCSAAFIKQMNNTLFTFPSRETTISNLAFLASRLLPLARKHHAAVTIQRQFRAKLCRITVSRRIQGMRLAHACAEYVQKQNRRVDAAITIQRAYREHVDAKICKLSADVLAVQTLARGWAARKNLLKGTVSEQRVMGGW